MAPVNAPFSCPNSSEAISEAGMAAQFTRIKARPERLERLCMARAISSFPVPVSPNMRTVESVGATFATCDSTRRSGSEDPTISSNIEERSISSRSTRFSFCVRSSLRLRSSMSVPVAYQRMISPCSSCSGLNWIKNQRYRPSFRNARCSISNGKPRNSAASRSSCRRSRSSGWKMRARKSEEMTSSMVSPV